QLGERDVLRDRDRACEPRAPDHRVGQPRRTAPRSDAARSGPGHPPDRATTRRRGELRATGAGWGLLALGIAAAARHPVTMRSSALFLAAAMALTACSGDDDPTSDVDATPASAGTVADAAAPVEPVELPTSYPADVPVPADVVLENAEEHVGTS